MKYDVNVQEKKPKKHNRRNQRHKVKNAGLIPQQTTKIRQEYLDYDYIDQLSEEEKAWLNKFTEEYLNAALVLDDDNEIIPEENIHKDPKYKKLIYDANNSRNRDKYGQLKTQHKQYNKLIQYENAVNTIEEKQDISTSIEDNYIDFLDKKTVDQFLIEYELFMKTFTEFDE